MAYKLEIYNDKKGEFRSRFRAPNGQLMFSGERYKQIASVSNAIESIKKNVNGAEIEDQT